MLLAGARHLPQFGSAAAAWHAALSDAGAPAAWPGEWLAALRAFAAVAGFAIALSGAGRGFGHWLGRAGAPGAERAIVRLLAGWAVAGLTLVGLAGCGLYLRPVLVAVLLVPVAIGLRRTHRAHGSAGRRTRPPPDASGRWYGAVWVAAIGALAVAALPLTTDPDSLMQHLAIAGRALAGGNLTSPPGNLAFHFWAPNELLRGWMLVAGGGSAACLPSVLAHALAALLLAGIVGRPAGAGWGRVAAAVWMTHSLTLGSAMNAKPDAWLAPLGLAGALLALRGAPLTGGWLLGAAVAAKPVAAPYAVAVGLLAASRLGLPRFVLAASVPVVPWAVKTWLFTGDPAYPLGWPWFRGLGMTDALHALHVEYIADVTHAGIVSGWADRVTALWAHVMSGGVSPVFLALLPLLWTAAPRRAFGWRWSAAVTVALVAWMAGPIQFRYLLAALPAWVAAGCVGLAAAGAAGRVVAAALVAAQVAAFVARPELGDRLPAGIGLEPRAAYVRRALPVRAGSLAAISRLPAGAVVALIGSPFGVPAPRQMLAHNFTEPPFFYAALRASRDAAGLSRRLRRLRVTHVLYNPPGATFHRRRQAAWPMTLRDLTLWSAWWRAHAREVSRSSRADPVGGFEVLYALSDRPAGPAPMAWLPGIEGVLGYFEEMFNREGFAGGMRRLQDAAPAIGGYGSILHLTGSVWTNLDADRALALFRRADATGLRDVIFAEEWRDLAVRTGDLGPPPASPGRGSRR